MRAARSRTTRTSQVVDPAAHGREQVLPADVDQPRRAGRRLPEDARRAVRVPRDHPRQRRSGVVHARAAADDRRLRQQARRRPADARRPPLVRRRRLGRHAGRRSAAGGRSTARRTPKYFSRAVPGAPDARRRDLPGHADRRRRKSVDARSGTTCRRCRRVNPVRQAKPGATVLLTGTDEPQAGSDRARLSALRARQGDRAAGSGLLDLEDGSRRCRSTDTTHAMFWRRLVRWLVDGVPDQVNVSTTADRVEPGEPVKLTAEVLDSAVRRSQRQPRRRARHVAVGQDHRSAGRVDGDARTASTARRSCRTSRGSTTSRSTAARDQKDLGIADDARARRRPATPSTSTPRCARRC